MKNTKNIIRNLLVFILVIFITFYVVFKNADIYQILDALGKVDLKFIAIGIACMAMFIVCEAINIGRTLKTLGEKSTMLRNIKYSLIGFFFSSITPAASGGQPMQIYYMHKEGISVANSTLTFLINLSCVQIVTLSTAFVSLAFNIEYMNPPMIVFFIIGVSLNASALLLLLISIFSRRMTRGIINLTIKIMRFFRVKNIDEKKNKFEKELAKYQASALYARQNRKLIIRTLLTTYVQFFFYFSITYFVYRSFGFNEYTIFRLVSMQSVLYATVSGIPSPGAVGVSEGGYLALFGVVYTEKGMLDSAMLLNRGVNFYLYVIISCIVVIINAMRYKRIDKYDIDDDDDDIDKMELSQAE